MTKKRLYEWVLFTLVFFVLVIAFGVVLRFYLPDDFGNPNAGYQTFKDLIPLFIAIPASWLGYCFQRRLSYLTALRANYHDLVQVIQDAVQYTYLANPSQEHFASTMKGLSVATDSLRGVFKNLPSKDVLGLYPYENLKEIAKAISWLAPWETRTDEQRSRCRICITTTWASMHQALLLEFDTEVPDYPVSKYLVSRESITDLLIKGDLVEAHIEMERKNQRDRYERWTNSRVKRLSKAW